MPDVSSTAPARVRTWVAIDQHKLSLVAATLPSSGGQPEVVRVENTERAIRRFVERLGGAEGLAVAYEAGPCGYELQRLLSGMGVACDVIAPSLIPIRAGDRVKTDRRDAKKLVRLYRAGELFFVAAPSPAQEGLRDLVRARDDLRCARTAGRHRVVKALLRHGHIYRDGSAWTLRHRTWLSAQCLDDPLAQAALQHMLAHVVAWTPRSPRSTSSSSKSPPPSRGQTQSRGCAPSVESRPAQRWGCWRRSATSAASPRPGS
jgi:transposase